jgi:hypothetical protein
MVQLMAVVPLQKLFDADQDVRMEDDDDIPAITSMDTGMRVRMHAYKKCFSLHE